MKFDQKSFVIKKFQESLIKKFPNSYRLKTTRLKDAEMRGNVPKSHFRKVVN